MANPEAPQDGKELACVDCGAKFVFTDEEKARLQRLVDDGKIPDWHEPKRCLPCRAAKKKQAGNRPRSGGGQGRSGPRELHDVTCSECGQKAQVPFKPRGDKPVYCSDCFSKRR